MIRIQLYVFPQYSWRMAIQKRALSYTWVWHIYLLFSITWSVLWHRKKYRSTEAIYYINRQLKKDPLLLFSSVFTWTASSDTCLYAIWNVNGRRSAQCNCLSILTQVIRVIFAHEEFNLSSYINMQIFIFMFVA